MNENPHLPPVLGQARGKAARQSGRPLQVLTLTPFYPSEEDDAAGCFVAEPLDALAHAGVVNTVFAVQAGLSREASPARDRRRDGMVAVSVVARRIWASDCGCVSFRANCGRKCASCSDHTGSILSMRMRHCPAGMPPCCLSAELGLPYVVSVHGLDAFSTEQVSGRAGEWCRRISQRVYRSSRRVICISEHVREQVLGGHRVRVPDVRRVQRRGSGVVFARDRSCFRRG